jgi:hypothetical protein
MSTTLKVANGFFTIVAIVVALYTLTKWASAVLVWGDAFAFSQALTWTVITLVAFVPVFALDRIEGDGD